MADAAGRRRHRISSRLAHAAGHVARLVPDAPVGVRVFRGAGPAERELDLHGAPIATAARPAAPEPITLAWAGWRVQWTVADAEKANQAEAGRGGPGRVVLSAPHRTNLNDTC